MKQPLSRHSRAALEVLGSLIKTRRIERKMTAQEVADRVGISRDTLRRIEAGEPGPRIGAVFEAASIVNLPLFDLEETALFKDRDRRREHLALLPKQIRTTRRKDIDDNF